MKKGVITMIFMFLSVTLGSIVTLTGCGSCFGEDEPDPIKISNASASLVDISNFLEGGNDDVYYDIRPVVEIKDIYDYDSIGISMKIETTIAELQLKNIKGSFLSSTFACDWVISNLSTITSIDIYSDVDYGNYVASNSLIDIFGISKYNELSTIDEKAYLDQQYIEHYEELLFILHRAPTMEATHTFTIELTLDDGKVISVQLEPITIRP